MKPALSLIAASVFLLNACGGSSSDSAIPGLKADTNVALLSRGASASSSHNSSDAKNLIDGNNNTSWTSASGQKIVVDFGSIEKIKSIKLTRQAASAAIGSNPDILIELSTNGSNYTASNLSVVTRRHCLHQSNHKHYNHELHHGRARYPLYPYYFSEWQSL